MPLIADFTLARQEDSPLTISMSPTVPIGAWNIEFTCQKRFGGQTDLISKITNSGYNSVSGITIVNSGNGTFSVTINSNETSGLQYGNYAYLIERLGSGTRTILVEGYLILTP